MFMLGIMDQAAFNNALKVKYAAGGIADAFYKKHPLLDLLPKKQFAGRVVEHAVRISAPAGRSATFATAQANQSASTIKAFLIGSSTYPLARYYAPASIDNLVLDLDAEAIVDALNFEIDGAMAAATDAASIQLFGDGSGLLGQLANSGVGTPTITLGNANDVVKFEVGDVLSLSPNADGSAIRTGTVVLIAVDRDAGTLTCSGNISAGIGAAANTDYIYRSGDATKAMKGFGAWLPYDPADASVRSSALAATFFGVVRSADATRLGGVTFDGRALAIEEALQKAAVRLAREGGEPDLVILNPDKYAELAIALGNKMVLVDVKGDASVGVQGIQLISQGFKMVVVCDRHCPSNRAYMLEKATWTLYEVGSLPRLLDQDELQLLRAATADQSEVRIGWYAQLACSSPGKNAVIAL